MPPAPVPARIPALDAARGLAATLVVVHHVLRCTPGLDGAQFWSTAGADSWWIRLLAMGDLSVALFFVLSGASLAISTDLRGFSAKHFFVRRFLRIYPLYLATILTFFLLRPLYRLLVPVPPGDWLSPQFVIPLDAATWASFLTMTPNLFGQPAVFNSALWTLPIEAQFYLFFPLFVLLVRSSKVRGTIMIALLCAGVYLINVLHEIFGQDVFPRIPGTTLGRLWEFGGGFALGIHAEAIKNWLRTWVPVPVRAAACIVSLMVARFRLLGVQGFYLPANFFDVLFSFLVVSLCLSLAPPREQNRVAEFLSEIGKISYSLYLLHMIPLCIAAPLLKSLRLSPLAYGISLFVVAYPCSVLLSRFVYYRFEERFVRFGKSLTRGTLASTVELR